MIQTLKWAISENLSKFKMCLFFYISIPYLGISSTITFKHVLQAIYKDIPCFTEYNIICTISKKKWKKKYGDCHVPLYLSPHFCDLAQPTFSVLYLVSFYSPSIWPNEPLVCPAHSCLLSLYWSCGLLYQVVGKAMWSECNCSSYSSNAVLLGLCALEECSLSCSRIFTMIPCL